MKQIKFEFRRKNVQIIVIICFVKLFFLGAASAQTITIHQVDKPVREALHVIENVGNVVFFYNNNDVDLDRKVSVRANNLTIEKVLEQLFANTQNTYKIDGRQVYIMKKTVRVEESALLQKKTITGKVTDVNGEPIIGANIIEKGTRNGTVSNIDGDFNLEVSPNVTIQISYIGYITLDIATGDRESINIVLREDAKALDELVVIGYEAILRRDLTGSVTSIGADEIIQSKSSSFQETMQGRMAGLQMTSSSGEVGSAVNISIRGSNTVYGSSSPLYVIDGVPYDIDENEVASERIDDNYGQYSSSNPLATLNPEDIESIDVLKDASATAIYGSRGANGVIIVTTKSGRIGKPIIEYNTTFSFFNPIKKLKVLDAKEYIDYRRVVVPNSSLFYYDTNADGLFTELDEPRDPYALPFHNWQDEILRTGISNTHNLSVSGGRDGTTFSTSIGYSNHQPILMNNSSNRYNVRARLDHTHNRIRFGLSLNIGYMESEGATNLGVIQSLTFARPIEYYNEGVDLVDRYISPISMIKDSYRNVSLLRNDISTYISYKLNKHLDFRNSLGGFFSSSKGKEFYSSQTTWGLARNGVGILQDKKTYSLTNTSQLNYLGMFNGNNHILKGMLAFEISHYNFEDFYIRNTNFLDESTGINDISKGSILDDLTSSKDVRNRISYFGRLNYTLLQKHLFTTSFRFDGSDKFGPGKRFGFFPSFAYAWAISEEKFMKRDKNLISNLKLRLSYGETGNERIPSFRYLGSTANAYYNDVLGLVPASLSNPKLSWETTIQYNAGLDVGLFKDRVSMNIDIYTKQTMNMLLPAYIPSRTGYLQQWQNLGRVDNTGIEFHLNTININKNDFKWSTDFNISSNRNTVKNLGDTNYIPVNITGESIRDQGMVIVGEPLGTAYGYVFDGVYQINDFNWQDNNNPQIPHEERNYELKEGIVYQTGVLVQPGSFKFKDMNGDGFIDLENDRKVIGRSFPKHFGGISNTISWKQFDFNILFDWSYGNQLFNIARYRLEGGVYSTWQNILYDFWHNRWTPDNPTNTYGDIASYNLPAQFSSSYYVEDASWLRLKNVIFGYNIPTHLTAKLGISNLRIFFTGTNLVTWTNYSGYDPEVSSNNMLLPGVDRISYPRSRSYLFGLNISF